MTNHPAVIVAAVSALNDELTILATAFDEADPQYIDIARAALQRCIWTVAYLADYAQRHGARPSAATLEQLIEEGRTGWRHA